MNSRDKSYNSSSGWERKKDRKRGRLYSGCGHISCSPRATQCPPYVWASPGFTTFSGNTSLVLIYSRCKGKRDILSNKTTQTHFSIYAFILLVEYKVEEKVTPTGENYNSAFVILMPTKSRRGMNKIITDYKYEDGCEYFKMLVIII